MIEQIKQKAKEIHDKVTKTISLERSLLDATSNENWTTPTKILSEIADATYNYQEFAVVMRFIWERLMEQKNKNWRKTFKVLYLIEYLLKNGAPRCIGEFKDEIYQIRTLNDYQFHENSVDRGEAIREKVKAIVELINDNQLLEQVKNLFTQNYQEREQAKKIRERLSGVGSMSSDVNGGRYGGQSYKNNNHSNSNVTPNYSGQGGSTNQKPQPYQGSSLDNNGKYDDYEFKGSLDKYKTKETKPTVSPSKVEQQPEIKEDKKPVQNSALLKLPKPGEKGSLETSKSSQNQQVVQPQNTQQNQGGASLLDFDDEQPVQQMQQIQQVQQGQQQQQKLQKQQNDDWDNQEWNWSTGNDQNQPQQQQTVKQNIQPQQTQAPQQPTQPNINQLNDIFMVKSSQQLQQQANILQQNTQTQQQPKNDPFMMKSPQQYQQQANQLQQNTQYQQQNFNQNQFQQNNQNNFYQQSQTQTNQYQQNSYQQQQPQNTSFQPQNKPSPPQQQKNDDFDQFQDFQGQQNQKQKNQKPKVFNDVEMNLINLTDLKNDPTVQKKEQQPISNDFSGSYSNNNPGLLYTTQDELDMFSMSPNKVQGTNYNQAQHFNNNNMNQVYNNMNNMGMQGGQGYNPNQGVNYMGYNQQYQQQQQYNNNNMGYNQFNQQQQQQGYGYNQGRR